MCEEIYKRLFCFRGLCCEFVVLKIFERLLKTLFWFFCHCVDDACWICKKKFLLEVVLLWDMMLNSLCSSRCPKHLFVGDLFLLYQMHVDDECLRCVNFVPEIVLLRGCKC
jgi:hypothetical protein